MKFKSKLKFLKNSSLHNVPNCGERLPHLWTQSTPICSPALTICSMLCDSCQVTLPPWGRGQCAGQRPLIAWRQTATKTASYVVALPHVCCLSPSTWITRSNLSSIYCWSVPSSCWDSILLSNPKWMHYREIVFLCMLHLWKLLKQFW
jgi:hypothetical protein